MGKYPSGIGLTDGIAMMSAIEIAHSCRVELTVTTRGTGHNGLAHIDLVARFATLPESDLPKEVSVSHEWPTKVARSFEGLLYNLCWQLDYAIQKAYEQMPLSEK